ncbi:MAG: hypothetical protein JSU83_09545 [Deltaproteobacteria bacterium]|nr:MAG: hypothetical protein JSU83_09545 [Deltaproteobacteria bacterium]
MKKVSTSVFDSYHFGSSIALSDQQLRQLITIFNRPAKPSGSTLGGRSAVTVTQITGIGPVVVKYYTRGGFIRHLVKSKYIRWGNIRSQAEFGLLQKVRNLGINAPKPVVYAYQGGLIYKAWLVTEEIKQHQTLAQLSLTDPDQAYLLMRKVATQISMLIHNKIIHVDLHPGNVLVDNTKDVFLIDFDKAHICRLKKNKLRDKYLNRWKRAVIKHRLPDTLWKEMQKDLRESEAFDP